MLPRTPFFSYRARPKIGEADRTEVKGLFRATTLYWMRFKVDRDFSINISSQRSERWSNESKKGKERNLRREGQIKTSKLPLDCPGNLTLSLRQTFVPKSLSLFFPSRFIKPRLNWALSSEQRNATKARSCSLGCLWRATSVCAPSHYLLFYSV